jgi:hypothetical protein
MQIQFSDKDKFDVMRTYLTGNDYKFTSYIDSLQVRFFYPTTFEHACEGIVEHGIRRDADYTVQDTENVLPDLGNAYSAA